jgi:hypothetical protein
VHDALHTDFGPVFVGENGRASDEHIGPGVDRQRCRVSIDATVDLQITAGLATL